MGEYNRIRRYVEEQPWAMQPAAFGVLLDIVDFRTSGGTFTDEELEERIPKVDAPVESRTGKAAVIPIYGTIMPRANIMSEFSGGTSLQKLQTQLQAADRDPDITTIILDVASPGGSVELVPETAEVIRNLTTKTVAVANASAASAAYWLAAQADEFVVTPSGEVGSIGVWTAHTNIAAREKREGVQTTLVSAGKYKVEGNPFGPLDDEARADMQSKVDHYYDMFIRDVALGRGVASDVVANGFGEGRMVVASDAVRQGMVDRVAPLEQVVAEYANGQAPVAIAASAKVAGYFDNPNFGVPGNDQRLRFDPDSGKWSCPPTIDGDHYYGHVAPMGLCLRGRVDKCITPPDSDLEGFMRGYAPAANGQRTGVITLTDSGVHGHSTVGVGAAEATKYYDSVGRGVADVRVGKDAYGIWFSGMIRPGTTKADRYALAASDVSGHWEMGQRGIPMLVGLPAVNVGGYPKGYLTAEEVAQGIAASVMLNDENVIDDTHTDDCGCHDTAADIDLATVLTFVDRRDGA